MLVCRKFRMARIGDANQGGARMKNYLIGGIALLTLYAAPAMAADMPVKAMPAPAPVASWTGFYIGINGGGAWGSVDPSVRDIGPDSFFAGANVPAVTTNGSQSFNMSARLPAGQHAHLFQAGRAVLGVEEGFA